MNAEPKVTGQANDLASQEQRRPQPKWAAKIEDLFIPAPGRHVEVRVLKEQANIPPGNVLVRDVDGEHDVPLRDDQIVDLAEGNVFYAVPPDEAPKPTHGHAVPKIAFFIDDRPEETFRADQTGATLREWFGFEPDVQLFRDFESPHDQPIGLEDSAKFVDGPVFYTRRKHPTLTIYVNEKPFGEDQGVKHKMTGADIARLLVSDPQNYDVYRLPGDEVIGLDRTIEIHNHEKFRVIRKTVQGGYEVARIERELNTLRQGGAKATFVPELPAVVYHDIPAREGYPHASSTDVLVLVPGGYPGQALDGAFLPQGSPLFGRVAGNPQPQTLQALNRVWQLVSYHPHANGGAPPWDKDKHGLHTYIDELLTWIYRARQ
jgi:hypothetical protein